MTSESRLYTFSQETTTHLRNFRLRTSRAATLQAQIFHIDKSTLEIIPSSIGTTYTSLLDLADDLPENAPRFILLSYPLTLSDGRKSVPYVMLYYMPENCGQALRMVYAGAKELFATKAEVGKVIDVAEEDDVLGIGKVLGEK